MHEIPIGKSGTVTWFKRVPPEWVGAYRIAGWVIEPVAPSHHDVHCVMMRYGGVLNPDAEPPIPMGTPHVTRKFNPPPMRRRRQ